MERFQSNVGNAFNNAGNVANNMVNNVGTNIANVQTNVGDALNEFGSAAQVAANSSQEFLNANSMAAKIAFILLVLIVFSVLVVLGVNLVAYFTQTSINPYVVKGMIDGNNSVTQPGNLIGRSNNGSFGMEFSWSVWLQVNDIGGAQQKYQHVFNKGNGAYSISATTIDGVSYPMGTGLATVTNAPGLYLVNNNSQVALHVVMDSVDPNAEAMTLDVTGIPLNKKWMHVVLRLENTMLDVYVNGTIAGRQVLSSVPKQNYGDIQICQNGGFQGKLSDLRYFSHALSAFEINQIVTTGPNTTASSLAGAAASKGSPYYLSSSWYFSKL
jgi:Concanavalin A-like lectin/glucanases superfamily